MKFPRALQSIIVAAVACWWLPAHAMKFEFVTVPAGNVFIIGRGPIVNGDTARLQQKLAGSGQYGRTPALALDSPGGNVVEGERLAALIRARGLTVVIPPDSKCVSACFLLLAASLNRFAAADALIGVHSASENGDETDLSLAVTTLMARSAGDLGIPPAIIGKMVQATPGRVEWLTRDDLVSMDVFVFDSDVVTAMDTIASHSQMSPAPSARAAMPPVAVPPAQMNVTIRTDFDRGRDERRKWNDWIATLGGAYRDGVASAQSQVLQGQPASCNGADGLSRGDYTLGCETATGFLREIAQHIASSTEYAAGWGSAAPPEALLAEYSGAYFCGRQVARLRLQVFASSSGARRTVFSFGPQPTSPGIPRGSFALEGSIDLQGGGLSLNPVEWISRPPGYAWLGLLGRSDDGGQTFNGRVSGNSSCSIFTLRRTREPAAAR